MNPLHHLQDSFTHQWNQEIHDRKNLDDSIHSISNFSVNDHIHQYNHFNNNNDKSKKVIKAYLIHHHLNIKILKTEEKIPNQVTPITPNKRPWPFIVIETILAFCALVIPIAIVIASKSDNNTGRNPSSFNNSQSIPTELSPNSLSPKPKWKFDTNSIRWINKDWFLTQAGRNAWDEWDFSLAVGTNSSPILEEHWGTWLKEPLNLHPWRTYYMLCQFLDSAEKRERVMALGSIENLQNYFIKNGLATNNELSS
ncbi:hypothetical protein O181_101978 [Austropuccinia psidii MF-1]|uniref:Uncharacterized protein n=1 Tax=Austropuccinia psidii MF-1 TaxID=1389203 RepID=A0A9Q3PHN3_9BASI|nr:hypothetical protein [Austropuccinia psidii MF-1]